MQKAKVFMNGRSQAVRLPKEFRVEGDEVAVTRLGDAIVLQPIKKTWLDIYHEMSEIPSFLDEREDSPPQEREFF
jgi:antitoxin VapB